MSRSITQSVFARLALMTAISVASCTSPSAVEQAADPVMSCDTPIMVFGTRASIKAPGFTQSVKLSDVPISDTTVGYGPSAGYRDELTLMDGVFHIATPESGDMVSLSHDVSPEKGAGFLVASSPAGWKAVQPVADLTGLEGIESLLTDTAEAAGCPAGAAFPFKLTGTASQASWSAVGKPTGAKGGAEDVAVEIVGIYAPGPEDTYFLPDGRTLHAHAHIVGTQITGHLGQIGALSDVALYVPAAHQP
ncbi:hypothetical protein [Hyphomonas oceanitis]|uniref:Acetolactate decarboxylase n=1 Tax=Hyphomonas oceanitis SCH89 TaxID=1280953 RepID=A0A059G6I3_9PROT|nr:hypothetical protein [Hyphomonas oceanitis]KDA02205.1 hypothetical protein HOC_11598 [Hyphomonas oceanitis SCH89]